MLALVAGSVTSCSGGGAGLPSAATTAVSAAPGVPIKPVTRAVDQSVWFAGFKIVLGAATLHQGVASQRQLDIEATFANQGADAGTINAFMDLTSASQHYAFDNSAAELPHVPAKGSLKGRLSFGVDDKFGFDDAVLTFGRTAHQQAVVPLGSSARLVTLLPVPVKAGGSATAGIFKLELTGAELRSDNLTDHTEATAGQRFLYVTFNIAATKSVNFAGSNLSLQLPAGAAVEASGVAPLIVDAGTSRQAQQARFALSDPTEGNYNLVLIDDSVAPPVRGVLGMSLPASL